MATTYPGGLRKRGGLLDYEDTIKPTPRNPFLGGVADLLDQAYKLPEMPRLGVPGLDFVAANRNRLMDMLDIGSVQKTAEAMAYGNRLGTGRGMTYQPLPETMGAAMTVAPFAGKAIRATEGLPVGASIKLIGKSIFDDATKYHQKVPEITSINIGNLKRMNAGEVADVSDEVAAKMDFSKPIQVSVFSNGELRIVDGHHRVAAAKKLGMTSLPVELQAINAKGSTLNQLALDATYPQAEAMRLAQQRAALPVEQGGLGLLESNTAMDRAKAMGFDTDVYHGSKQDFNKFKGDQPIFAAEDPEIARLYGSFIYPLKLRGKVLEVSDIGKDGAINRFPNNLAKELNIPRKELEDLRMPRQQFNDSSFLDKLEYLFNKRFGDPQFSDIGEREMVNKLPRYGIDRLKVTDMSDMGGSQTQHMIPAGSENIRSRFAAFDPFRRTAATAAAMGVAAPDLLAAETQEELKRRQMRGLLAP